MPNGCTNAMKMDHRTSGSTIHSSTTNLKTLKGLFEEPKMLHRRDFLRENKLSLKELQRATTGKFLQSKQEEEKRTPWRKQTPKAQESATNRRSSSHQKFSTNDENLHNQQRQNGTSHCEMGNGMVHQTNGGVLRRSRSHIRSVKNDRTETMMPRNGFNNGCEFHCCCGSTPSTTTSTNGKLDRIESRDQEIQTEDICDEQFLYEALKRCSTNDVKNRICGGGEDNVYMGQQQPSFRRYDAQEEIPPPPPAPLNAMNDISPRCPSERALSQHHLQLEENDGDAKSTRSHRSSQDNNNNSSRSVHSVMNSARNCGGGDDVDNRSVVHTLYAADNRSHRSFNRAADGDNVSQCPSTSSTTHSHRSKGHAADQQQLGSARSQQPEDRFSEAEYQMNGGGGDGMAADYSADGGPPSQRSRHSTISQQSSKKKPTTNGTPKSGGRDEVRDVRLPRYLEKEKRAKEEERERQANRDPNCPFGHYAMDDDLRVQHLIKAQRRMSELIQELNRMPMTTETLRLRTRKREIEKELQQIETDIRVYSKPKVYLPIPIKVPPTHYEYSNPNQTSYPVAN